jgi:probable rRNA maturation factor
MKVTDTNTKGSAKEAGMIPLSEEIEISVEVEFRGLVDEDSVRRIARRVLKAEGPTPPYEVSLVFTDCRTVQQLNRDYRGVDEPTDVLAFGMLPQKEDNPSFVLPPDGIAHLGEVIISYPRAVEQAQEEGHSVDKELALLIIHGILHLLGYDHEQPEEEAKMRAREKELLEQIA